MYVNDSKGLVWLAHPRAASTSTSRALVHRHGFRLWPIHKPQDRPTGHHSGLCFCEECPDWSNWEIACTVRHHCDALVSWWFYQKAVSVVEMGEPFVEWLHKRYAMYWPDPKNFWGLHIPPATKILKYENITQELSEWLGEEVELGQYHVMKNRERAWEPYVPTGARAYVKMRYGHEMQKLGYAC